jgi:Ca2+-binding RTX toxin-like protein
MRKPSAAGVDSSERDTGREAIDAQLLQPPWVPSGAGTHAHPGPKEESTMKPLSRISATTLAALATSALTASVALAATIDGGPRGERLRGTNAADRIAGHGGPDRIRALAGPDVLAGGLGRDFIHAGLGDDVSAGQAGRDVMAGGPADDRQDGGPGNDRIFANRGVDESWGGPGDDVLWAMARKDVVPGPDGAVDTVADTLHGGAGDDRFRTRDGEGDRIDCGDGRDVAVLDTVDVIVDATAENAIGSCELVHRAAPTQRGGQEEDAQEPTPAS